MFTTRSTMIASAMVLAMSAGALGQFSGSATPTIFLPFTDGATPMNIAYHPGFKQYYGSGGGYPGVYGHVWDLNGNVLQNGQTVNIDVRSFNYNSNSGQLEVMQYGADWGYNGGGRWEVVLDGSGYFTGNNNLLTYQLQNSSDQAMPAYNASQDVFYSRQDGSDQVNVVDAGSGNWINTISLDLAAAGINGWDLTYYANSFDNQKQWLVYTNPNDQRAYIFNTSGTYLGYNDLPGVSMGGGYGDGGIVNGQLWVFDWNQYGWQGFELVPAPGAGALLAVAGVAACRRRRS